MTLLMVNDAVAAVNAMKSEIDWKEYGVSEVFVAYNVSEGQQVIREQKVDILLCDIEMPGGYGMELIRWIRENKYDIDCIMLTCHADFIYAKEALLLNCQDYLLMPIEYEKIGYTIQKVINRREERLQNNRLQEYGKTWLKSKENEAQTAEGNTKTIKEVVDECVAYIVENLSDEKLNVNACADHFHLNPVYLNRIFKKEKKIAISQYIIQEKMALAARLLESTNCSAIVIAEQVGYLNYSYFSTVFRKFYGCSPMQYKSEKFNFENQKLKK